MKFIKKYVLSFFLFLLPFALLAAKEDHRVEQQPIALEKALSLSQRGTLTQKENGFVYLDVSNAFIDELGPLLEVPGQLHLRPTAARSMGAHVSTFHEKEAIVPEELGSSFSFETKELRSFTLHTRDGLKKLWVLAVDSPELEHLREAYGCSPKLKGYDYHITLGKQMPSAPEGWETIEFLSHYNFLDSATLELETEGDFITVPDEAVQTVAANIEGVGQLRLKGNGFVYVDVDDQFIEQVTPLLPLEHAFAPLKTGAKKMGAHISAIHEDEMIGKEIWNLEEAGHWFNFEVKELRYVDKGAKRLWLLAVDAPGLQRLRTHYGLKPKLKGHDFHITLGYEQIEKELALENAA